MKKGSKASLVKAHPKIEAEMAHFKARFANDEDINIINKYGKLKQKISEVNESEFRRLQLAKLEAQMTSKMKEIRVDERNLFYMIQKRNESNTIPKTNTA